MEVIWWWALGTWCVFGFGLVGVFLWLWHRDSRHLRAYKRDMQCVNSAHSCLSCGATATELQLHSHKRDKVAVWLCKDRKLCRETLILKNQLDLMP